MFRIPRVNTSMRELDRLKCIQGLIDKQLKQKAVAERLGLTIRQVRPPIAADFENWILCVGGSTDE
jgi:hypothetical protein